MWQQAGILILGSAGFSKLFTFILERNLAHKYDEKIKRLESELAQNNFRFTHVFTLQAEAISELHKLILPLIQAATEHIQSIFNPQSEGKKEAKEKFEKLSSEFHTYFNANLIFIPIETTLKINSFFKTVEMYALQNELLLSAVNVRVGSPHLDEVMERRGNTVDKLRSEISELHSSIIQDFQEILGTKNKPKDKNNNNTFQNQKCVPAAEL